MRTRTFRPPSVDQWGPFAAWAAFAAFAAWAARGLGFGSFAKPGPGLFPLLLTAIIGILAVVDLLFVTEASEPRAEPEDAEEARQLKRQRLLVILSVVFFAVLLPYLGAVLVSLLLVMFLLVVVEKRPVAPSLAVGIGVSVGMYLILAAAFGVPLPAGPLEVLLQR